MFKDMDFDQMFHNKSYFDLFVSFSSSCVLCIWLNAVINASLFSLFKQQAFSTDMSLLFLNQRVKLVV